MEGGSPDPKDPPLDLPLHLLLHLQEADAEVRNLISVCLTEMKAEEEVTSDDLPANGSLNYVCTEVHNAMAEFDELFKPVSLKDVNSMLSNLSNDQLRIFSKVKSFVEAQLSGITTEPIRMFVSGWGVLVKISQLIQLALGY